MKLYNGNKWVDEIDTVGRNIADYSDRLKPLINVPARPEGSLWPQGLSYDEEEQVFYVCYTGTLDGSYATRISRYTLEGTLIDSKYPRSSSANSDIPITSSESIPFWRSSGKLYFLLAGATTGKDRYIYNWTDNTLVSTTPMTTLGGYRGDFDGDYYVTSDSNDSTSGVSRLYYYDKESIKNNSPVLSKTLPLQYRSRNRKLQGLTTNKGITVGLTGPASTMPGIIAWSSNGNQLFSYEYKRENFGRLVNKYFPGTITDVSNYHTEAESTFSSESGQLIFGSVINNGSSARYVVFESGNPTYDQVEITPDIESVDTDWIPLTIITPDYFELYQASSRFEIRRSGVTVGLRGELRTKQDGWSGQKVASLAGMGRGFVPLVGNSSVQIGSGTGRFCCSVNTVGDVTLTRSDSSLNVTNQWLNINMVFFTD